MIALFLFFISDLILFNLLKKWIIFSLLGYFITLQIYVKNKNRFSFEYFYIPLFLLLLQDQLLNERVGISLIYLIPLVVFCQKSHFFLNISKKSLCLIVFFIVLLSQDIVIKRLILGQNITFYSTLIKISINLLIEYIVLLGMWGNRSLVK